MSQKKKQASARLKKEPSKASKANSQVKKSWGRWLLSTLAKVAFAGFCVLAIFAIYTDAKVRQIFEGQRWQVPVQVFGEVKQIVKGDKLSLPALAKSLKIMDYKKVTKVTQAGQFALSQKRIIVFRRAFEFSDGFSSAVKITIDVEQNSANASVVKQLYRENSLVDKVVLEPALLARIVPNNQEDRVLVSLEEIPSTLLDTLLLIEDRNFYHHQGISWLGIVRALYHNIRAGRTVQGGSTLTQQLVKNMYLTRERSLTRKLQEALMAIILELRYSKDQLLEAYVNEVYLGQHYANGIYGFGLAAQFYFGHSISELSPEQMALLIAQVKGPSYYDPWKHPTRAKQRRDLILKLMFDKALLSKNDYIDAIDSELSIRKNRRFSQQKYPAYLQLVKQELNQYIDSEVQKTGIRVFTGFSHLSQQLLEQSVNAQLPILEAKYQQRDLQAAMIVTDIHSGEIRALVGGRERGYAGFNRALLAQRPVGSLIKPAVYLAALERYEQYNFATLLDDQSVTFTNDAGHQWQPKNYDNQYRGQVSLITALVQSLNIPTVNLGMKLGLENVADAIHLLGYPKEIITRPSMLLGALNMSPLEINELYLPIAAQGFYLPSHAINQVLSKEGDTLWRFDTPKEQRLSANGAYLIDYALAQVTQTGTAKSLTWRLKSSVVAGKTGTSNELRDSWFIGYDNKHLVTTWLGKDNNEPTGLTGSSGALSLFSHYMKKQGVENKQSAVPESIASTLFEKKTGNAVLGDCAGTVAYPAVAAGIKKVKGCLHKAPDKRSWFEKVFGD